jgi:hypothetical protein
MITKINDFIKIIKIHFVPPFPGDGVGYFCPGLKSALLPTIEPPVLSILTVFEEEDEDDDEDDIGINKY